jgi:hypothetical protein
MSILKSVFLFLLLAVLAFAQGASVNQVAGPPPDNRVSQFFYSGSNLQYICSAAVLQQPTTFTVAATTLTSIAVSTNVGTITFSSTSYLWPGARVTVSGSTTAALNGTYTITAVSSATATITTVGVGDATYNNAALVITTNAPLLNKSVWAIQVLTYTASTLTGTYWAGGSYAAVPQGLACSNRAAY